MLVKTYMLLWSLSQGLTMSILRGKGELYDPLVPLATLAIFHFACIYEGFFDVYIVLDKLYTGNHPEGIPHALHSAKLAEDAKAEYNSGVGCLDMKETNEALPDGMLMGQRRTLQ